MISLVATACASSATLNSESTEAAGPAEAATEEAPVAAGLVESPPGQQAPDQEVGDSPSKPTGEPTATAHPIADADTELPPAPIGFENLASSKPVGPAPISIEIEDINVADADVIPVGVNEDLTFEVPPADQVGWYEFGSSPGEAGSAVLAAHIAFDGVDGVFRYLEDVEVGSVVTIGFDDGTSRRYQIEEVTEYVKEALPASLWARDGREQLALITCGGTFNHDLSSYESNTVAVAVPI